MIDKKDLIDKILYNTTDEQLLSAMLTVINGIISGPATRAITLQYMDQMNKAINLSLAQYDQLDEFEKQGLPATPFDARRIATDLHAANEPYLCDKVHGYYYPAMDGDKHVKIFFAIKMSDDTLTVTRVEELV